MGIECSRCTVEVPSVGDFSVIRNEKGEEVCFLDAVWSETEDGIMVLGPGYTEKTESKPWIDHVAKSFPGTEEEALAAGWKPNEFGWGCPDCVEIAQSNEDEDLLAEQFVIAAEEAAEALKHQHDGETQTGEES